MRRTTRGPRYAVALYRVSPAEQGHSGLGLEAQCRAVGTFVASQGWMLVAEHSDVALGKDDRRPGFQQPWPAAANSGLRWQQHGWTGSRGGPGRHRVRAPEGH